MILALGAAFSIENLGAVPLAICNTYIEHKQLSNHMKHIYFGFYFLIIDIYVLVFIPILVIENLT